MNKSQLITATCKRLREGNERKEITVPAHSFSISDSDGNIKEFKYKLDRKSVMYTVDDVEAILSACIETIINTLREGEDVSIHGFGKWFLKQHDERRSRDIRNPEIWYDVPAYFVPKFSCGIDLKLAAKAYEELSKDIFRASEIMPKESDNI